MFLKHIFMIRLLPINDLILKRIDGLDIPSKMKDVLKEILKAEEKMKILNDKNYTDNLSKVLQNYADDDDIKEFCTKYVS